MAKTVVTKWVCDVCSMPADIVDGRDCPEGWRRLVIGDRPTANLNEPEYREHDWQVCAECAEAVRILVQRITRESATRVWT